MNYSSIIPVTVMEIEALAEELLASVLLVVISLSGESLYTGEVSDTTITGKLANITAKATKGISLFTSTAPSSGKDRSLH